MKHKCLIIKMLGIGDVIMALPTYYYLVERYGIESVDWMIDRNALSVLDGLVPPQNLIEVDYGAFRNGCVATLSEIIYCNKKILLGGYKDVYLLHGDIRYTLLTLINLFKLRHAANFPFRRKVIVSGRYLGYNHFAFVSSDDGPRTPFFKYYSKARNELLKNVINANLGSSVQPSNGKILLSMGLGGNVGDPTSNSRRLSIKKWIELYQTLNVMSLDVDILWHKGWDTAVLNNLIDCGCSIVETTSIPELMGALSTCKMVVSTDNGVFHIASMLGLKTVGVFGPTIFNERVPKHASNTIEFKSSVKLDCMPCFDGKSVSHCGDVYCMESINIKSLADCVFAEYLSATPLM